MGEKTVNCKFPSESLVPKGETGVLNFLNKYPKYNGKDVTIAIFDSGIDPKAFGLQKTPDFDVKVIERYDCTGCGDIDMSTTVTPDENGYITGLSNRKLKLTEFMKNKNVNADSYRIGLKCISDIYPPKVREKIIADSKAKDWEEPHKKIIANIQREIDTFDSKHTNGSNLNIKEKLKKEDLDSSMEFLNYAEKKFSEIKTTYDFVLFNTEDGWVTVIDLDQTGDLTTGLQLREYTLSKDIKSIDDHFSISINVHNDGKVLEIVGMCSSHGTHVSSIAAGYNESNHELDGVAPGARLMSFTIGDSRLGSMETGVGLARAIIKVMELCNSGNKVDIINMSYGEHAHWSNNGRIGELMNEVVNKYGVIWVASAGNHGPALCTIGTPPDISQATIIGVGAYVSPDMMEAEYALRQKLPGNVYTWTSRDPCIDGGQGVTICAPGAAITSVPEFTLTRAQLMNGTSMAAPHVAGAIALLVSGLKDKKLNYTPYSIKRALWNTATKLTYVDQFAQGNGLLNVDKAFEYLTQYANEIETNVRFSVSVGSQNAKGIHIRERLLKKTKEFNVTIEPVFLNDKSVSPKEKINFNKRLTLVPSETWVECGAYLDLCYQSRTIVVHVDPSGLTPGVHAASIKVYDTICIEKGILFEIPITVVQPEIQLNETSTIFFSGNPIICKPNSIIRKFLLVPNNATSAILRLISTDPEHHTGGKFYVHTMQIMPHKFCKSVETQKILPVTNNIETVHAFKCEGSNILEICIAKYWSDFGDISIKFSIEFHGIYTNSGNVMHGANGIFRLDLNTCTAQEISPSITLKNAVMVLKPTEAKITALSERDVVPPSRQIYQHILSYNFHLSKSYEVSVHAPLFSNVLYESEFESQLWMLFDSNKMMVGCGDAYSNTNFIKLDKGDFVLRLQVRHEKKDLLEKISEATMLISLKLPTSVSLDIFSSYNLATVQGKKIAPVKLCARTSKPIYVGPLTNEKITKSGIPSQCSWLEGVISYTKDDLSRKNDCINFQYILSDSPPTKKNNNSGGSKENKSKSDEYKEGLRDYQIGMIPKLDRETAEQLYGELLVAFPKHLQNHYALIQNIDTNELKSQLPFSFKKSINSQLIDKKEKIVELRDNLQKIADLSETIIVESDVENLLAFYGLKLDTRSDAVKIKSNMDKQKNLLLDAYVKRAISLSKIHIIDEVLKESNKSDLIEILDKLHIEIGKFIEHSDVKVSLFSIWHGYINSHFGRMTKYLIKNYDEKLQKEYLEELVEVANEKKWKHICNAIDRAIITLNPLAYRLF